MSAGKPAQRTVRTRWAIVVVSALLALYALVSTDASADSDVSPPPGDCWGGVLSGDPLHCYVFEEAQKAGLMEIDSMYLSPGLAPLYVYLKRSELPNAKLLDFLRDKTFEYMAQSGGAAYLDRNCGSSTGKRWHGCIMLALDQPHWVVNYDIESLVLPKSLEYPFIAVRVGGAEARRSERGWASWEQLWPVQVGEASASGSAGFDVSDVDLTNFPEIDCRANEFYYGPMYSSCWVWSTGGDPGVAGMHFFESSATIYVQTTTPIPEDPVELEALKQRVYPGYEKEPLSWGYRNIIRGPRTSYEIEFIPVKYNFGQLWRWSVILNRFALSASNTIGIDFGFVSDNADDFSPSSRITMWLNGVEPSGSNDYTWNWDRVRNILGVWTLNPVATIAALPTLVPALGIPTDAVGVVKRTDNRPIIPIALPGTAHPTQTPTQAPAVMRAPPPELDCADDSGAPLLSFCDAW